MVEADIAARDSSSKRSITLAPSSFEIWAARESYDTAPRRRYHYVPQNWRIPRGSPATRWARLTGHNGDLRQP